MENNGSGKLVIEKLRRSQTKHLSKPVLLEETGSSPIIRFAVFLFAGILVLFLVWSVITQLEEVASAEGKVIPSSQVRKIQHPLGGVVAKISIEEGMFVEKGQTVIWLSSSEHEAQLEVKEIQRGGLGARKERLQFFLSQINKNLKQFDFKNIRLIAYHRKILNSLKDFDKIEGEILSSQIEQLKNDLGVLASQEERLINQRRSLKKELSAREVLVLRGEVTKVTLLNLRRQNQNVENELAQIPLKCYKLFVDHQKNSLSEISRINNELAQIDQLIASAKDNLFHSRIKIPVNGVVHNLAVQAAGEVVSPGKTIFEIVPREKNLMAEIKILPKDIGHISLNQKAVLKFSAYEVSNYGSLEGFVERMSATTFLDDKNKPYYKAIVKLEKVYIGDDPNSNLILPGMTLEADIQTGSKSVLQYLLKPIFKSGRQALRER